MGYLESEIKHEQGFETRVLRNAQVEIVVVPELGARVISLKNLRKGRDWLWHPAGGLKLFRNTFGDDFSTSPLAGVDECIPTIAPCQWQGRNLPDHGEAWTSAWQVDEEAWKSGILKTSVKFTISPFELERTIALHNDSVHFDYQLKNCGNATESFLWAMHPLIRLQVEDTLKLPSSTLSLLEEKRWIDTLDATMFKENYIKTFAWPVKEGIATIINSKSGDGLEFQWNPSQNDTLGLWLTNGGWNGHHHFAIEPTNGAPDALTAAAAQKRCGTVASGATIQWQVRLRIF